MKRRFTALAIAAILTTLALITHACGIWPFNGVVVTISNVGSTDYESCLVIVTGRSHDLGTLHADETRTTSVAPTGETHVELDLREYDGSKLCLDVDCYFEPRGYSGTVSVRLGDGKIYRVVNDVGIGFP